MTETNSGSSFPSSSHFFFFLVSLFPLFYYTIIFAYFSSLPPSFFPLSFFLSLTHCYSYISCILPFFPFFNFFFPFPHFFFFIIFSFSLSYFHLFFSCFFIFFSYFFPLFLNFLLPFFVTNKFFTLYYFPHSFLLQLNTLLSPFLSSSTPSFFSAVLYLHFFFWPFLPTISDVVWLHPF